MEDSKNESKEIKKPLLIKIKGNEYLLYNKSENGTFGKVKMMEGVLDKKKYALKILYKKYYEDDFQNEIKIYEYFNKIDNKYIPKLYDSDIILYKPNKKLNLFIIDYAEKDDLFFYIKYSNEDCGIPEEYAKYIFKRIVQGIQFCHNNKVCHLDIKPENIVLNEEFEPMIVDFGFAKILSELKRELKNCDEKRGTQFYKAPEMYIEKGKISGIDADIFSLGVLLMYMVSKYFYFQLEKLNENDEKYFQEKNHQECYEICKKKMKGIRNSIMNKKNISLELKNLYLNMISIDPKERLSLEEVLKDPWLKEINEIESDEEKFAKFKEDYKNYMQRIIDKLNKSSEVNTNKNKKDKEEADETSNSRAIRENIKQYFNSKMKPKKLINQKYNYKYFMKLKGDLNPAEFMNILINEMEKKYNDDCQIAPDEKKLKLTVAFDEKECEMDIKLYKLGENEHIVAFDRKNGEDKIEIFYDYVSEIKDIIKEIFE